MSALHDQRRRTASTSARRGTMPKSDISDLAALRSHPASWLRARLRQATRAARRERTQLPVDARGTQIIALPKAPTAGESSRSTSPGSLALSDEALRDAYRVLQVFGGADLETMLDQFREDLIRYDCHPTVAEARASAIRNFLAEALGPAAAAPAKRGR